MTICAWKAQNYAIVLSCTELHYRLKYALGVGTLVFLLIIIAPQKMNYDFSVAHKYRTKQTNLGGVWENKGESREAWPKLHYNHLPTQSLYLMKQKSI